MKPNNFFRIPERWGSVNPNRLRSFLHNPLWIGFLPAVAVGFGVLFALSACVGLDPAGRALHYGLLAGGLNAFGWIIGIWCVTGPDEEPKEEEATQEPPANFVNRYAIGIGSILFLAAIFFSDLLHLIDGSVSWQKTIVAMVSKVSTVACVILPVWLSYRNK